MPINKDALIRYRVINRSLTSRFKKYPSLEELRESCGHELGKVVSIRTIQDDLYRMRHDEGLGYLAPIEFSKTHNGYYYTKEDYSIDKIPLKLDELEALQFAVSILGQFRDVEVLSKFSGAVDKINQAFKINRLQQSEHTKQIIQIEQAPGMTGTEYLGPLISAISDCNKIKVLYRPFGDKAEKEYWLHPYLIKEYKNRWYLVAYSEQSRGIRTFGLDRITNLETKTDTFQMQTGFDPDLYFKHSYGITYLERPPEKVVLGFTEKQAHYVRTKPLHHSQKESGPLHGFMLFQYLLVPSYELVSDILGMGSEAVVIEPRHLADSVSDELKKNLGQYSLRR